MLVHCVRSMNFLCAGPGYYFDRWPLADG